MTEISAQVDLAHPAERVWRALTQRELLVRWFTEVGADTGMRDRLLLHTTGLPGFDVAVDVEVVEHRVPDSLVLRCDEAGRLSRLSCTLTETVDGCRLSVTETLEHGRWSTEQRANRERYYQHAVSGRLPAILDWVAFREVDLRRAEGPPTAELPVTTLVGDPVGGRRRGTVWIAALAGLVLVTGAAVWAVLPAQSRPVAGPGPALSPSTTQVSSPPPRPAGSSARPTRPAAPPSLRPSRSGAPSPSASAASPTPPPPALAARYTTVSTRVLGYTAEVVIDNPGGVAVDDWSLVVTLAPSATVGGVTGAQWRQEGQVVTFTGAAVPAGGSRSLRFDVRDADLLVKAPRSCAVDGTPCTGL